MRPYYDDGVVTIYEADALELLRSLPAASVSLVATDPPYFRVKDEAWDRAWPNERAFLRWIGQLCREWRRVLTPNGSLYVFTSPQMAHGVERVVRRSFRVLTNIRWRKDAGWHQKAEEESLRSPFPASETVLFCEQFGDAYADASLALHKDVYAPIGRAVAEKRIAAGLARWEIDTVCAPSRKPTGLCYRWEEGACLPTLEQWVAFCQRCGDRREYEDLRREYEDLRREYEDLRRPFNATPDAPYTDVWDFPTVAQYPGKHPCEKPLAMMEHIVRLSSRPGDVVLDTFVGSGATGEAARNLGRKAIVGDSDPRWVRRTAERVSQGTLFTDAA